MSKYTTAKSPADFPAPMQFAVWWGEHFFRIYKNLSLVKTAVTGDCGYDGHTRRDIKIYEWTGESWDLIYHLPQGTNRLEHELWKRGAAPKTMAVSDASVEAAIASIMNVNQTEEA